MIVVVIVGLLAGIAIPEFDGVRLRAYNTAALADLRNAHKEIERFFNEYYRYPANDDELMAEGYSLSPGVSFTQFAIRAAGSAGPTRVHIHIEHEGSSQYYHSEYPRGEKLELRWKKGPK